MPEIKQVWCANHREWERADDYIDFPVAPVWRHYYHRCGLTPYPAQDDSPTANGDQLQQALEELADAISRLASLPFEGGRFRPVPPTTGQRGTVDL